MMSDLNIFHEKMSDFVSFALFGFTTTVNPNNANETKSDIFSWNIFKSDIILKKIKLRNFDFESH